MTRNNLTRRGALRAGVAAGAGLAAVVNASRHRSGTPPRRRATRPGEVGAVVRGHRPLQPRRSRWRPARSAYHSPLRLSVRAWLA